MGSNGKHGAYRRALKIKRKESRIRRVMVMVMESTRIGCLFLIAIEDQENEGSTVQRTDKQSRQADTARQSKAKRKRAQGCHKTKNRKEERVSHSQGARLVKIAQKNAYKLHTKHKWQAKKIT